MRKNKPDISLCMIVKNEADYLPICLESVADLVDEIIIVDTGSTDDTVAVARKFGAQVFPFNWCDDFSAARNESLHHATGEWILYLDADERVDEPNKQKIRTLLQQHPEAVAMNVRVVIPQPGNNLVTGFGLDYCRLFRNAPDIRFEGVVHEQILPSIFRHGGDILKTNIEIDHWGFGRRQKRRDIRNERNVRLLEAEVDKNPGDSFLRYHLAIAYRTVGRSHDAIVQFQQVIRQGDLKPELQANSAMFLAQLYLAQSDIDRAEIYANRALQILPGEHFPYYILATTSLSRGDVHMAAERLEALMKLASQKSSYIPVVKIDMDQVYLDLGSCYFLQGEHDRARSCFEQVLHRNPQSWQANYLLGKFFLQRQDRKTAISYYERVLDLKPEYEAARQELSICYHE